LDGFTSFQNNKHQNVSKAGHLNLLFFRGGTMSKNKEVQNSSELLTELRSLSWQIQGFAYLFERQKLDEAPPAEVEKLYYGIGLSLRQLGERIEVITDTL